MLLFAGKYRSESTRLSTWDYSWPWWYFVTIVVKDRKSLFGQIETDSVQLSRLGGIAERFWNEIPCHHTTVELDSFVIMPNHMHGIIILGEETSRDVQLNVSTVISSYAPGVFFIKGPSKRVVRYVFTNPMKICIVSDNVIEESPLPPKIWNVVLVCPPRNRCFERSHDDGQ